MRINKKYKFVIIEGFILLFMFLTKVIIFNKLIENQGSYLIIGLISIGYFIFIMSISSFISSNKKRTFMLVIYTIISVIMLIDSAYFKYFNQLSSIVTLKQFSQLGTIEESIGYVLEPVHLLLVLDIVPIWIYNYYKQKKDLFKEYEINSKIDIQKKLVITGLIAIVLLSSVITISDFNENINLSMQEFFTYHINDIYSTIFKSSEIENIDDDFINNTKIKSNNRLYGIARERNVIIIQVESLQNFVINNFYEDQEITPNLNKLLKQDSIYYKRYYQQLGRGNTSDAEFVTNNSLYPAMDGQTYLVYYDNTYYGLPWILKDNGYNTAAFHGYKGSFWNREKAYPYQGFDTFINEDNYEIGEIIGFGLNDKDFFTQSMDYLKEMESPFYAFMVTLSSHHPFEIPEKFQQLELKKEHEGTLFGNYIQSIHFTDEAIGQFIEDLKAYGLYEDAIICIYGDHFGLSSTDENNKKIMTEYLGYEYDFDEMMRIPLIIHIPGTGIIEENSIVGGQIDFLPTILNLLGIQNEKAIMFGQDLNNAKEGFVAQQTYMIKGSYISDDVAFSMSRDGIFKHSRAWNIETREPIDIMYCRENYEKAIDEINKSNYILSNDLLMDILKNEATGRKKQNKQNKSIEPQLYISHAGGRVEGLTYTNSRESIDNSYNKGYKLIELDIEWTADNNLVLIHDWKEYVEQAFSAEPKKYSTEEFKSFEMVNGLTQMTMDDLVEWLRKHEGIYIVTDIKTDNIKALKMISQRYPDVIDRFVPQIYFIDQYLKVQEMGYRNIILTLCLSNYTDEELIDFVNRHNIFAITMPIERARTKLPFKLKKENVFVYAYTINDIEIKQELEKNGVDGFYTDDLLP